MPSSPTNTECAICHEPYISLEPKNGNISTKATANEPTNTTSGTHNVNMAEIITCHHQFHDKCLRNWVIDYSSNTCPCCRANLYTAHGINGITRVPTPSPVEIRVRRLQSLLADLLQVAREEVGFEEYVDRLTRWSTHIEDVRGLLHDFRDIPEPPASLADIVQLYEELYMRVRTMMLAINSNSEQRLDELGRGGHEHPN